MFNGQPLQSTPVCTSEAECTASRGGKAEEKAKRERGAQRHRLVGVISWSARATASCSLCPFLGFADLARRGVPDVLSSRGREWRRSARGKSLERAST